MGLRYVHEKSARWDANKARIIGKAPAHTFGSGWERERDEGEMLPGDWWRFEDGGETVGYGWMDVNWGDAEILLATAPDARGQGVGSFILETLAAQARARGLNYMHNVLSPKHPRFDEVAAWLKKRGFSSGEDDTLLRARVPPYPAA